MFTTIVESTKYSQDLLLEALEQVIFALNNEPVLYLSDQHTVEAARLDVNGSTVKNIDFFAVATSFSWGSSEYFPRDQIFSFIISGDVYFDVSFWSRGRARISDFQELTDNQSITDYLFRWAVNINGGEEQDIISGFAKSDGLMGYGGSDIIYGNAGNDILYGGNYLSDLKTDKNDVLFGGVGNDTLYGDRGKDRLVGGEDNDRLYGGWGKDVFVFNIKAR